MNPIVEVMADPKDPVPLVELKQHLVIFVEDPPGPDSARRVYNLYLQNCGDIFKIYKSTFEGPLAQDWDRSARERFEREELPALRQTTDWGYGFSDNKPRDSWLFMFHGFRPSEIPAKASFYRFEFAWDVNTGIPPWLRSADEQGGRVLIWLRWILSSGAGPTGPTKPSHSTGFLPWQCGTGAAKSWMSNSPQPR